MLRCCKERTYIYFVSFIVAALMQAIEQQHELYRRGVVVLVFCSQSILCFCLRYAYRDVYTCVGGLKLTRYLL